MDDAEPLSDAEAEVVLSALSDPLVWAVSEGTYPVIHESSSYSIIGADLEWNAMKRPNLAQIVAANPSSPISAYRNSVDQATHIYSSLEAAKDACERHRATGKWE